VSTASNAMAELHRGNPFRGPDVVEAWSHTDEDVLLSFVLSHALDTEQGALAGVERPPVRRTRRLKQIALVAAAAVLLGAIGLALSLTSTGSPRAFAAWTATTTSPSATQLAAADASCQKAWDFELLPPAVAQTLPTSLSPLVLTDSRGPFEMLVYAGPSGRQACLWDKGFITVSGNGETLPPANPHAIGVPAVPFVGGTRDITYADGDAGTQVTAVTLVLADGTHVEATLKNGLYAAWWPSKTDVNSAEVTTPQGTFRQEFGSIGPNS
jgi:hypothetical protein